MSDESLHGTGIELAHKEDWAISIPPGTPVQHIISALQALPVGLVTQGSFGISRLDTIAFERKQETAE